MFIALRPAVVRLGLLSLVALATVPQAGAFDLQFTIIDNASGFTAAEKTLIQDALVHVEGMWEQVLGGYQPGITVPSVQISVLPMTSGLASATFSNTTTGGLNPANGSPFTVTTAGFLNLNVNEIENFSNWQGDGANGKNYLDELIAHEVGHALGIGTLWSSNGVYGFNFQYTGSYGAAAYQAEFTPPLNYVPVENGGGAGTPHAHWDQRMRSGGEAGDVNGPGGVWALDPSTGAVDALGRDRAFELMTGAIDPDYYEPFISRTTVESMRDLGYVVRAFEDFNADGAVNLLDRDVLLANMGATNLEIDSLKFGDANRDRVVDQADLVLWAAAAGVPEPATWLLAALGIALGAIRSARFARG